MSIDLGSSGQSIPTATEMLLGAARKFDRAPINSVYLVICPSTNRKGTGFLVQENKVVTCKHVVKDEETVKIRLLSGYGRVHSIAQKVEDNDRDLAVLFADKQLGEGLHLADSDLNQVGEQVWTWGYPLGYNGPAPLLSVGYLSGYSYHKDPPDYSRDAKFYVVNGAFNPGNSGGPLFCASHEKVVGIVRSKHAPLTEFVASALKALSENRTGVVFTGTDKDGKAIQFVESQVVAEILEYYRSLTQVMIGEAVAVSELLEFLKHLS
jgi:hypothetical protein